MGVPALLLHQLLAVLIWSAGEGEGEGEGPRAKASAAATLAAAPARAPPPALEGGRDGSRRACSGRLSAVLSPNNATARGSEGGPWLEPYVLGVRVLSLEFGVWSLEFGVWSLEFGVWGKELRMQGSKLRV